MATPEGLRRRRNTSSSVQEGSEMPSINSYYDLDEEVVFTPVQTRAVSPSRGRNLPHNAAETVKFMENLNAIATKSDAPNAAIPGVEPHSIFQYPFSDVGIAGIGFLFGVGAMVLVLQWAQLSNMNFGTSIMLASFVCVLGSALIASRFSKRGNKNADLEA